MPRWCVALLIALLLFSGRLSAEDPVRDAVVKIHVTQRPPDFLRPWTKGRPSKTSGTGVIIDGNRILTNAHVVLYHSRVHVQANQSSKRELAEVLAMAPEVDLALVSVKDKSFFEGKPALEISSDLPRLKQTINVYGYPIGGEQISITEGIISRIECTRIFSGYGLRIQIDAALNPGNSGGPAIMDGKMAGLAFSVVSGADNIGYVIAAEELERFLANIPDGEYLEKPDFYDSVQTVENESLRSWLKLSAEQGGLVVTEPESEDENYPLKELDVITKIGDYELDRKGNVQITEDLKLSHRYLVPRLALDNKLPATVIRDGKLIDVQLPMIRNRELLVPELNGTYPEYFIFGPMVFTTPSQEFLKAVRYATATLASLESPLVSRWLDKPAFEGEELVILGSRLFTHASSEGYERTAFAVVKEINGVPVRNLKHAAELLRDCEEEYVRLDLDGAATNLLTFNYQEIIDATEEILEDEGIRSQYSDSLKSVFEGE